MTSYLWIGNDRNQKTDDITHQRIEYEEPKTQSSLRALLFVLFMRTILFTGSAIRIAFAFNILIVYSESFLNFCAKGGIVVGTKIS